MYVFMYVYIYIYIYIYIYAHSPRPMRIVRVHASNRKLPDGVRTDGDRRRGAAILPNELSWEHVGKMWQDVATRGHLKQQITQCRGFVALL